MNTMHRIAVRGCLGAFAMMLALASVSAAPPAVPPPQGASGKDAAARKASTACPEGGSSQDRPSCLKEFAAAQAEARRGRLDTGEDAATLARNALRRCDAVLSEDRDACERMARGEGQVSGSVAGGGVLKSIATPGTVLAEPPADPPAR